MREFVTPEILEDMENYHPGKVEEVLDVLDLVKGDSYEEIMENVSKIVSVMMRQTMQFKKRIFS